MGMNCVALIEEHEKQQGKRMTCILSLATDVIQSYDFTESPRIIQIDPVIMWDPGRHPCCLQAEQRTERKAAAAK